MQLLLKRWGGYFGLGFSIRTSNSDGVLTYASLYLPSEPNTCKDTEYLTKPRRKKAKPPAGCYDKDDMSSLELAYMYGDNCESPRNKRILYSYFWNGKQGANAQVKEREAKLNGNYSMCTFENHYLPPM